VLSFGVAEGIKAIQWAIPWRKQPENAYWLNRAEEREEKMQHMNEKREGAINISAYHKVSPCALYYLFFLILFLLRIVLSLVSHSCA
jgi:hypothetical protein